MGVIWAFCVAAETSVGSPEGVLSLSLFLSALALSLSAAQPQLSLSLSQILADRLLRAGEKERSPQGGELVLEGPRDGV